MKAEILRKITLRNCGLTMGELKDAVDRVPDGGSVVVCKIVGRTTSAREGTTDKGTYIKLGGDFTAINMLTGAVYQSGAAIIPTFIAEQLAAQLEQTPAVEFGIEIGVRRMKESVTGYQFTVSPLIEAKPTQGMLTLLDAAGIDLAALPAPQPKAEKVVSEDAPKRGRPPTKKD